MYGPESSPFLGILLVLFLVLLYFAPTFVASRRKHHNAMAIFVLNVALGWTFLGWVGALVWASTAVRKPE